jgi:hypothetical protein|tara:strand:+ start:73 stop:438 length:366 start_codon:yes stop_codon:yes gene_type:complete
MDIPEFFRFFFINFETKKIEHMSVNDPLDKYDKLDEYQIKEAEYIIMDKAFRNSFLIVTKKKTFEEVMESKDGALLVHNPDDGITDYELENMMQYFVDEEEYEKCAVLKTMYPKIEWDIIT